MKGPTPRRLWKYATGPLGLRRYFRSPGDGRLQPQIPAQALLWAMLVGQILRQWSFNGLEALVRSRARRALGVSSDFGDDTLGYFTERLDPAPTRAAIVQVVRRAKRNKAFDNSRFIGLAVDGTTAGRCQEQTCAWCRPVRDAQKQTIGYHHQLVLLSVVGTGLSLPLDVEPYGPGDSEYAAGQRLLRRAASQLGVRFADYVVVDGEYAKAPFLHLVTELGWKVVARLKANLPELLQAAQERFRQQPPTLRFRDGKDQVEVWDAEDFTPWETLQWEWVRVIRYRQHRPDGTVVEAYWLTNFPGSRVGTRSLYRLAKSRWEIENQGFNDAKNRHGLEHLCHHEVNSILIGWLLNVFALTIERLYRLRFLHRGNHPIRSAIELVRALWLSLSHPAAVDTS